MMTVKESDVHESDADEIEPAEPTVDDTAEKDSDVEALDKANETKTARRLRLSISIRSLVIAAVITTLAAGVGVLGWLYIGAKHELDVQARHTDNTNHAEKVALDYAVNAAGIDWATLTRGRSNSSPGPARN